MFYADCSLQQKLNALRQLDAEILDLVAEEEIEGEIERADLLEENVQLAIANIENALSPDTVESNVRSLKSLGVSRESYGDLLSSILMNQLPQEFRLVITREMGDDDWQLDQLLDIFKRELEARERAGGSTVNKGQPSPQKPKRREEGTTHALSTGGDANCPTCTYCRGKHPPRDCQTVPDILARKELLKSTGDVLFACEKIKLVVTAQPSSSVITARADSMLVFAQPT